MWKKFSSILLTVLLCLVCAVASAQAAEDSAPRAAAPQEKPSRIELVMILDKSGSMHGLEADTIGGFNAMIEKEKKLDAKVNVTTVLFNDKIDTIYNREDIRRIKPSGRRSRAARRHSLTPSVIPSCTWSSRARQTGRGQR